MFEQTNITTTGAGVLCDELQSRIARAYDIEDGEVFHAFVCQPDKSCGRWVLCQMSGGETFKCVERGDEFPASWIAAWEYVDRPIIIPSIVAVKR